MCKEERTVNQETNVQEKEARVRQPWTAQRVGDILLNNALLIIMAIAVVYIAIKNPNFIKPASLINILSQTAACRIGHRRLYRADRYRPVRRPCRGYHRLYLCISAAERR